MVREKKDAAKILASFFDGGLFTPLSGGGAVVVANGVCGGQPVYAVCQTGAAISAADVGIMTRTLTLAAKTGNPVVTFYASQGAMLEDGLGALKAAADLNVAIAKISGVVPQVAVVLGVCGGTAAMAAASADFCIMQKDAELFVHAPFLQKKDEKAMAGTAEFAAKAGVAALVAKDEAEAIAKAASLIAHLPGNNLSLPADFEYQSPSGVFATKAYSAKKAVESLADVGSVFTLYDGYGSAVQTSLATVAGTVVGFVATGGAGTSLCTVCASKAARFVRMCDAFSIPVVTLISTDGFVQGTQDDLVGGIRSAARLAATYADATTAKIAILVGKAVGPAYVALGNADISIALEGSVVAPVEPSAAVSVLYKEEISKSDKSIEAATSALTDLYVQNVTSAAAVQRFGLAELLASPTTLRTVLEGALGILASKREQRLPKKHGNMPL